jgi:hypothetical protein
MKEPITPAFVQDFQILIAPSIGLSFVKIASIVEALSSVKLKRYHPPDSGKADGGPVSTF